MTAEPEESPSGVRGTALSPLRLKEITPGRYAVLFDGVRIGTVVDQTGKVREVFALLLSMKERAETAEGLLREVSDIRWAPDDWNYEDHGGRPGWRKFQRLVRQAITHTVIPPGPDEIEEEENLKDARTPVSPL
jgi:hypothetical protein